MDALQVENVPSFILRPCLVDLDEKYSFHKSKSQMCTFYTPHVIDGPESPPFLGLREV